VDGPLAGAAHQVDAGEDVPPLVGPADLQLDGLVVVEPEVVVGLEQHVGELGEGDPLLALHAGADRLPGHHLVHGHVAADVPEELDEGELRGPVPVVHEGRPRGALHVEDPRHLSRDGGHVGRQRGLVEQVALLRAARGVADHAGGATGEGDGAVAGVLEPPQDQQADEVPDVQARRRGIAAVVEGDGAVGEAPGEGGPVGGVVDEPAGIEVVEDPGHRPIVTAARRSGPTGPHAL
jgi:hypothetical protein